MIWLVFWVLFYHSWSEMIKFGWFSGDKISKNCSIYIINYTISLLFYQTNNAHTISNFKTKIKNHNPSKFSTTQFKSQQAFIYLNKNSYKIQYDINVTAEQSPKSQQKPTIIYVTAEQSKAKSNVLTKLASLPIMHLAR